MLFHYTGCLGSPLGGAADHAGPGRLELAAKDVVRRGVVYGELGFHLGFILSSLDGYHVISRAGEASASDVCHLQALRLVNALRCGRRSAPYCVSIKPCHFHHPWHQSIFQSGWLSQRLLPNTPPHLIFSSADQPSVRYLPRGKYSDPQRRVHVRISSFSGVRTSRMTKRRSEWEMGGV